MPIPARRPAAGLALCAALLLASPAPGGAVSPPGPQERARGFAHAVAKARIAGMCRYLAREAARRQGCGTTEADLGPLLNLAVDCASDIRVVRVRGSRARAEIPSAGVPGHPKGSRPPQRVTMRRLGGRWMITRLGLVHPSRSERAVGERFRPCG